MFTINFEWLEYDPKGYDTWKCGSIANLQKKDIATVKEILLQRFKGSIIHYFVERQ